MNIKAYRLKVSNHKYELRLAGYAIFKKKSIRGKVEARTHRFTTRFDQSDRERQTRLCLEARQQSHFRPRQARTSLHKKN